MASREAGRRLEGSFHVDDSRPSPDEIRSSQRKARIFFLTQLRQLLRMGSITNPITRLFSVVLT